MLLSQHVKHRLHYHKTFIDTDYWNLDRPLASGDGFFDQPQPRKKLSGRWPDCTKVP